MNNLAVSLSSFLRFLPFVSPSTLFPFFVDGVSRVPTPRERKEINKAFSRGQKTSRQRRSEFHRIRRVHIKKVGRERFFTRPRGTLKQVPLAWIEKRFYCDSQSLFPFSSLPLEARYSTLSDYWVNTLHTGWSQQPYDRGLKETGRKKGIKFSFLENCNLETEENNSPVNEWQVETV